MRSEEAFERRLRALTGLGVCSFQETCIMHRNLSPRGDPFETYSALRNTTSLTLNIVMETLIVSVFKEIRNVLSWQVKTVTMRGPGRRDTSYLSDLDETWSD